jgi:hypothetical protein
MTKYTRAALLQRRNARREDRARVKREKASQRALAARTANVAARTPATAMRHMPAPAPRRHPRAAHHKGFLIRNDADDMDFEGAQECACRVLRGGFRKCDPNSCAHLRAGFGCAHMSTLVRALHMLHAQPFGALPGVCGVPNRLGYGLYAYKYLPRGAVVALYFGRVAYEVPPSSHFVVDVPAVEGARRCWIVGSPQTCVAVNANHSCRPNVDMMRVRFPGSGPVPIVALFTTRKVRASAAKRVELTLRYDFADAETRGIACACGEGAACCGIFGCSAAVCTRRRAAAAR